MALLNGIKPAFVAKGYTQKHVIDYQETFFPVIKIATQYHWPLFQLDVNNAFLHGDLTEEVFMKVPGSLHYGSNIGCKLNKSLNSLKQASCQWFAKLTQELLHQGFVQSKNNYSLSIRKSSHSFILAAVYNIDGINGLKSHLHSVFSIKDLGPLSKYILLLYIMRRGIHLLY